MKKIFTLILLLSFALVPLAKADFFSDVQEKHYNGEAIQYLKDQKIVKGYSDGTYKPENRINRAEFTKIVIEAIYDDKNIDACKGSPFVDVPEKAWFAKYVCMAKKHSVVDGYPDKTFHPSNFINFAEASKIIDEALNVEQDKTGTNGEWFAGYIKGLEKKKAIPSTIQFFDKEITRGEMSEIIFRLKEKREDKVSASYDEITNPLPKIKSCEALMDKFKEYKSHEYYPVRYRGGGLLAEPMMDMATEGESVGSANSKKSASYSGADTSSDDYSKTNLQVEGVDEADIIKNDGSHIFMVKGDSVRIVRAFPPATMHEDAVIDFSEDSFYPNELYIDGDKLIVVGTVNNYYDVMPLKGEKEGAIRPYYYSNSQTKVFVYDISDRSQPKKLREVTFDGDYKSSRRIDNQLYLVLNANPNAWNWDKITNGNGFLPHFIDGEQEPKAMVECGDIRYFPGYNMPRYLMTVSFDVSDSESKINSNVILGSSNNIYASQSDLYVASRVVNYDRYTDWDWNRDYSRTQIFRFALNNGKMDFKARGEVKGNILNQFSMDAYNGNFRIATNSGDMWNDNNPAVNNVYVLNADMKTIGKLENLAKGERIYSTRFVGNRLYMVTFKQIDPLFVIGLSNPAKPVVLGELKIPGYSQYLHPYDANHIIGFGQETTENEWGGTVTDGFKMALFDVSDVNHPQQDFVEHIGGKGTYSELLNNHKALLFDKDKELLAFPIQIQEKVDSSELMCGKYHYSTCPSLCQRRCIPSSCDTDGNGITTCTSDCDGLGSCMNPSYDRYKTTFSGAVVYNINLTEGFKERGRISHFSDEDFNQSEEGYFPYNYNKNIQRIVYIGKYLYTIAQGGVKSSTMDTVQTVKYLELEEDKSIK